MGGREVGEFGVDSALSSSGKDKNKDKDAGEEGRVGLGAHGFRVGDVVRVEEIGAGGKTAKGKGGKDDVKNARVGVEGVVTRVGERSIWVACGDRGAPGKQDDDEGVQELWGKKIWM